MSTATAYEITETPNGVAVQVDDPPITLDLCGIAVTRSRVTGTLTVTRHDEAGATILLHDVVMLTTAASRAKAIATLTARGAKLAEGVLIALEQAARDRKAFTGRAPTLPRLDGAMTVLGDGNLVYLIRQDETLVVVTGSEVFEEPQARMRYRLPKLPDMESRLSSSALAAIREGGIERGGPDGVQLFEDVRALLARYIVWPSPHVPALLAVWVMGTYCFRLFTYYAYVVLGSIAKRSGKSLVLEVLSELAFNAAPPQTNPTAAAIYRDLDANHATLLLDEIESLGDRNKDDAGAVLSVLNVGFKSNGTVSRVEKRGERLVPVRYSAYSPKVLAGIQRPADTIRDRAVQIRLPRKRRGDTLPRFNVRQLGPSLQDIRDRLHLFALATSPDIRSLYDDAEQLVLPSGLDDRAKDIVESLFAIAAVIDAAAGTACVTGPLTMAVQALMLDRADDVGDEATLVRALEVLRGLLANGSGEIIVTATEAVPIFAKGELEWVTEPKHARALLRKLGFVSGSHRRGGSVIRGYKIERAAVADLWDRYGPIEAPGKGPLGEDPKAGAEPAHV